MTAKTTLATVWLDGCSGCHMSFLDLDERLLDLAAMVDLVYSPLVDRKDYPDDVDIALVEGAVATDEDLEKIRRIRQHTRVLVSFGDCAVTGNVPAMRNPFTVDEIMVQAYDRHVDRPPVRPDRELPVLLPHAVPVHEIVEVDVVVPGCPPSADIIWQVLTELAACRIPDLEGQLRFGSPAIGASP
jgi:NAD-reducing hydrogenase small subunit